MCILALLFLRSWCWHLGWLFPGWQGFFAWALCCLLFVQSFTSEWGAQREPWDIARLHCVQWFLQIQEASSTKIFIPGWGNCDNQRSWKVFNIAQRHSLLCIHVVLLCCALFVICFSTSWHVWVFLIPSMTWNVLWEGSWLLRYRDSRTWNSNPVCAADSVYDLEHYSLYASIFISENSIPVLADIVVFCVLWSVFFLPVDVKNRHNNYNYQTRKWIALSDFQGTYELTVHRSVFQNCIHWH